MVILVSLIVQITHDMARALSSLSPPQICLALKLDAYPKLAIAMVRSELQMRKVS